LVTDLLFTAETTPFRFYSNPGTRPRRGFRFVGPTICYAYMQAVGMVNDHTVDCFRHAALAAAAG
jgi:hypothetical protein